MATTDELIERLGGGGTIGLAVAAVVMAPALFPPLRRGLRGLAKAAIVQYLRVTVPTVAIGPAEEAEPVQEPVAARRGRRRGADAAAAPPSEEAAAAEPTRPAPRTRRAQPDAAADQGRSAETAAAPAPRARQPRRQQTVAAAPPAPVEADPAAEEGSNSASPAPMSFEPAPVAAIPGAEESQEPPIAAAPPEEAAGDATEAQPAPRRGRPPRAAEEGTENGALINLNTATARELTRLPRIGAQAAARIVEFRDREGPIRSLQQLRRADIVTPNTVRQIRDLVRF